MSEGKNVLILHSWYGNADAAWYPWLKKELECREYGVSLPDFPELRVDVPDMDTVLKRIETEAAFGSDTIVVGHSIGCLLAMRLAEKHIYSRMILISGWDFNTLTEGHRLFWKTLLDHQKIRNHVKDIVVINSDNDPYVSSFHAEEMAKRLNGRFILVSGAGHFTQIDGVESIPQLLDLF